MIDPIFDKSIEFLKGVGSQRAGILTKELNIQTFADLLHHYPFRYIDRTRFYKIRELNPEMPQVQVLGRIITIETVGEKAKRRLVATIRDDTGVLELVWFQGIRWIEKILQVGQVYTVFGKPAVFGNRISMSHPELERYQSQSALRGNMSLQPVYSSTEKLKQAGLDSRGLQRLQANLIDSVITKVEETLPDYLLQSVQLTKLNRAVFDIHFPASQDDLSKALRRLKFDELFFLQLKLLRIKLTRSSRFKGARFSTVGEKFNTFFNQRLAFELTEAQKRVIREIRQDTHRGVQMNRLLQGDVGSGKTVVALMMMLLAADNGFQACLMAPTEILAQQHFASLQAMAGEGLVRIELLTGSIKTRERKVIHQGLEAGEVDILVGTHAVIEDAVQFKNLGLVVIDEQHRFGVEQRARLWRKNSIPPHVLVMTATPIPRTLAMTLYGDLDASIIDELPANRKPIKTVHLYHSQRLRMFGFMREEIAKGRQIYIVYPLIKESEKLDLLYLEAGLNAIADEFPLPKYRISIVHGKLKPREKAFEMERFVKGETHIMVATTVIEVGVNVPNASVMIIENAERFGLSQLHQLRGRVGRGAEQSYCILVTGDKVSTDARKRIEAMVRTNDGFEIAELDLQLRGPGNIEGTQQSGVLDLKIADLSTDQELLQLARKTAIDVLTEDPGLEMEKNKRLRTYFADRPGEISWDKIS